MFYVFSLIVVAEEELRRKLWLHVPPSFLATLYSLYLKNTERLSTAYFSRCALQIAYFRKFEYQKNGSRFNDDQVSDLHRVRLTPDLLERTRGSALSRNFLCRAFLFLLCSYL